MSINNDITMLIYCKELFIIFLKLSYNISGDNPKERRLQQSGTLTQQKMFFSASIESPILGLHLLLTQDKNSKG